MVPGRVRVKLRNEDGSPVNPDIPSSESSRQLAAAAVGCPYARRTKFLVHLSLVLHSAPHLQCCAP